LFARAQEAKGVDPDPQASRPAVVELDEDLDLIDVMDGPADR
jgi:hypothetical protein